MTESLLPEIEVVELTPDYGKFIFQPLGRGFGSTLGNALRRVLLGALPGYAVTSVKIDGVQHEYSTIEHMKEDVIEFLLNVKGIRFRPVAPQEAPVSMTLDWTGEGTVKAGDIQKAGEYEIVNPGLHLATLDSKDASLSAEFQVMQGVGYKSPSEENEEAMIGEIPVDAVFTPIRNVNYEVQHTRVGQITDYDRLVMEIHTDETIGPKEAASEAARILAGYLSLITSMGDPVPVPEPDQQRPKETSELPDELYNLSIEDLKLSARTSNCLRRGNINTVGEVLERSDTELLALRNFGERSLKELKEHLTQIGAIQTSGDQEGYPDGADTATEVLTSYSTTGEEDTSEIEPVPPTTGRTFLPD